MRPVDCLPADLHQYYTGGWMLYAGETPVRVRVLEEKFLGQRSATGRYVAMAASKLMPWYPEGRCINYKGHGYYIERTAKQCARRTASLQHYLISYGAGGLTSSSITEGIMWALIKGCEYARMQDTQELRVGVSIAISPDIIIEGTTRPDIQNVRWCGQLSGQMQNGVYVPDFEGSCFTKLTRETIMELGIECL